MRRRLSHKLVLSEGAQGKQQCDLGTKGRLAFKVAFKDSET